MIFRFNNKQKDAAAGEKGRQDRLARSIVGHCIRWQVKWAAWMQNKTEGLSHKGKVVVLLLFCLLIALLPVLAGGSQGIALIDSFFRAGALVFGGGHVVLPLLQAEVVPPGWVGDGAFLAGYGAAQAVPGRGSGNR